MEIYLAGGFNGNMSPFWREYIASLDKGLGEDTCFANAKSAFLRGKDKDNLSFRISDLNILETFYYARNNPQVQRLLSIPKNFLLDSGAFTFMQDAKRAVDWDAYLEEYAEFVVRHKVSLFFELDIDALVGLAEVERLRAKLERLTGRRPIPVWHYGRGKDYFIGMCRDYPYVAIGGLVGEKATINFEQYFPWFIGTAHTSGAKIHGLGYTKINGLKRYHFDSVDSTSWLHGNRCGFVYRFDGENFTHSKRPEDKKLRCRSAALHNYSEWVRYLKYARVKL